LPGTGESVTGANFFETIKEVRDCARTGELSLLYVFNSKDKDKKATTFLKTLFKNEDLAVATKVFRCLELDTARNKPADSYFGKKIPVFLIFDAKGKLADEVRLPGYKAKSSSLLKAMMKASKGHGEMPLATFVKDYRKFLNDLDKLEGKKAVFAKKKARLTGGKIQAAKAGKDDKKKDDKKKSPKPVLSKSKQKKLDAEEKRLATQEKALLEQEVKLLKAVKAYNAPSGPKVAAAR